VNGALVPFANFGTVDLRIVWRVRRSEDFGAGECDGFEIENSKGVVLTGVGIVSNSAVQFVYQ